MAQVYFPVAPQMMGSGWTETSDREQFATGILWLKKSANIDTSPPQARGSLYEQVGGHGTVILNMSLHIWTVTLSFTVADNKETGLPASPLPARSADTELQQSCFQIYGWDTLSTCREVCIFAL